MDNFICSKSGVMDAHLMAMQDADPFLTMLHDLSAMGAAMRRVMTGALTNPQVRAPFHYFIYISFNLCSLLLNDYLIKIL